MIRELLKNKAGVVGLSILMLFAIISLYVVATFPLDYGIRYWSNPLYWQDYPKLAPPKWYNYFTKTKLVEHYVEDVTIPSGDDVKRWVFYYYFDADTFPQGVILKYSNLTFYRDVPIISVVVTRPDGQVVTLVDFDPIPPPRPGEGEPYRRFVESPRTLVLTTDPAVVRRVTSFVNARGGQCTTTEVRDRGLMPHIIFGNLRNSTCSAESFEPLHGVYVFELVMSGGVNDTISHVRLVIQGNVYGMMGTDYLGRDIAEGLLFGFPVALLIGGIVAIFATIIGVALGIISGYIGGRVDEGIQRFADILANLPTLPILILLVFILGPKLSNVVLVLIAFGWAGTTIIIRSMVLSVKTSVFVEAARLAGASSWWIMRRHILPQILPYSFALMIFSVPGAILAEASLSFLGLGDPSIPTWGQILQQAYDNGALQNFAWWWILTPGFLIVLTAVGFVLVFFALEPIVNPRLRRQ